MTHILNNLKCRLKIDFNRAIVSSLFLGLGFLAIKTANAQPSYNRFADYCLNYDQLPEATKVTVRILANRSINDETWDTIIGTDRCYQAEQELLNIEDRKFHATTGLGTVSDLTPLTTIDRNIVEIYLPGQEIQDLRPLAVFTNLERLNLERNPISDLTGLSSLTKLKELNLNYNLISDLSPLSSLTNLEKLSLYSQESAEIYWQASEEERQYPLESNLRDITPLASMTGLRELLLGSNKIGDVSPLASLTRLEKLDLSNNEITDVSSLETMSSLVKLYVGKNYVPPENRICPIDIESVCDFSEQRTAANSAEDAVNTEQTAEPVDRNSSRSQSQPPNAPPSDAPNESNTYPPTSEDRPTQDNGTTNRVEEEVRETIREAPGKVLDSLF